MKELFDLATTSDIIYLSTLFAFGIAIIWLAVWGRGMTSRNNFLNRSIEFYENQLDLSGMHVAVLEQALAEKDRIIADALRDNNEQIVRIGGFLQKLYVSKIGDCMRLWDILIRVHPYARLVGTDPAKLEKWLERLRGKKASGKRRATIPLN